MANERTKCPLTDDQIKHMVNRFLGWKLPEDFTPDAGISFKPILRDGEPWPEVWPVGTNLLMAVQAEAMIRYMVDGIQHGGVCLWCGFSTTRSSLDELADAIYAHLGECDASPVPTLIRERDTALAESRKRGEENLVLREALEASQTWLYNHPQQEGQENRRKLNEAVLSNTSATAQQTVERIEREALEKAWKRIKTLETRGLSGTFLNLMAYLGSFHAGRIRAAILGEKEKN